MRDSERDQRHLGVVDAGHLGRRTGGEVVDQVGGDIEGGGEDHGVRIDRAADAGHLEGEVAARGVDALEARRQSQLDAGQVEGVDEAVDQRARAGGQPEEDRGVGIGRGGGRPLGAEPLDQAAVIAQRGRELRRAGGQAQPVGVAGVHAAEQGRDETFEHLVAHAPAHDGAHRLVGCVGHAEAARVRAHRQVEAGPVDAVGTDGTRGTERVEVGRHAQHDALGEGTELAAAEQERLSRRRAHELAAQAERPAQVDGIGHARQEGVGRLVERVAGEGLGADLAAEPVPRLEHHHLERRVAGPGQLVGRAQTGDPATDDDDAHGQVRVAARSATAITRSASAPMTIGSSLSDRVRAKARPHSDATLAASMSRSKRISR